MVRRKQTGAQAKVVPATDVLDLYGLEPYVVKVEPGSGMSRYSDRFLVKSEVTDDARPVLVCPVTEITISDKSPMLYDSDRD